MTVKFSPDSRATPLQNTSNGLIAQTLAQARQKVNLALFVFSEQSLADVLDQRFQAGVTVKALIDRNFAFRPYSEGLDLLGVTRLNQCKPEAGNRPWALPTEFVGVPALPDGDKLHHKMAVIDEQVIITGSHNWSISANVNNDETLLILKNPAIAAHYQREFERLAALSDYGLPASVATIIKREVRDCATAEPAPNPLTTATPSVLVNLNTATLEELTTLPGIGPKLAQKIIDNRPYRSLKDIDNVPGIGPVKLEKLRRRITW